MSPSTELRPHLEPLGLVPSEGLAHASFKGTRRGREVQLGIAMRTKQHFVGVDNISVPRFQGWLLELTLPTSVKTRLVWSSSPPAVWTQLLLRWRGLRTVSGLPAASASDPAWAQGFLNGPGASAVQRLGAVPETQAPSVRFGPMGVSVVLGATSLSALGPSLGAWIDAALDLVEAAEQHPPPRDVAPTWLERKTAEAPKTAAVVIALTLLLGIPFALLAVVALAAGALFLIGGPRLVALGAILWVALFMPVAMAAAVWWHWPRQRT